MRQEIKLTLSGKQNLTLTNNGSKLIKIKIEDDGKNIEFAVESKDFFWEVKRFCKFDEVKHLYS